MTSKVTIFQSIKDTDTPFHREVGVILERIKNGSSKRLVKNIRTTKDKNERNELKKKLPALCFSGVFNKRKDSALVEHSGLICLDFDGYEKKKYAQKSDLATFLKTWKRPKWHALMRRK